MVRFSIACAFFAAVSTCAVAQQVSDVKTSSLLPQAMDGSVAVDAKRFCVYESQLYTEGAIKKVGEFTMICWRKETFSEEKQGDLVWENSALARGKDALGIVDSKKK